MANLVWLQGASDTGCTVSFLNASQPDVVQLISDFNLKIVYHPTISPASGRDTLEALHPFAQGGEPLDVLVVEGAVQRGPDGTGGYCRIGDRPFQDLVSELAGAASYTVAVGTCASYGGIPASGKNPTDATGLQFHKAKRGGILGSGYVSRSGLPVINIPGCPAHPDWICQTLMAVLLQKAGAIRLDEYQRPVDFFERMAHQGCPRNEYFEYKASSRRFTDPGCLYMYLGCKAPLVHADCNERLWNRQSSCTRAGAPCIGCTDPGFPDDAQPFYEFKRLAVQGIRRQLFYLISTGLVKFAAPKRLGAGNPIAGAIRDTLHFVLLKVRKLIPFGLAGGH